jgi:glycosyltransferase involved in cell wall biosynthesis
MISIVTPFFNEQECVREYYRRVTAALQTLGYPYEVITVSDGSTDNTDNILKDIIERDRCVRLLRLSRNTGQWAAISAGLAASRGEWVVVMDGDLQHAPEEIHLLVGKINEGYDLVSGSRVDRSESRFSRLVPSLVANALLRQVTGCSIRDMGGFKCLRGDLARNLRLRAGQHRLLPALVHLQGGRVGEIFVSAPPRFGGYSKYGLKRSLDVLLDIIMLWLQRSLGSRPMHAIGRVSLALLVLAVLFLAWALFGKLAYGEPILGRPAFFAGLSLGVLSVVMLFLAFVIDILSDIWSHQAEQSPYVAREIHAQTVDPVKTAATRAALGCDS